MKFLRQYKTYHVTLCQTVLAFLESHYPDVSKSRYKSWLKSKKILIDDRVAFSLHEKIDICSEVKVFFKRWYLPHGVEIVYLDPHLIVIDKPETLLSVDDDGKTGVSVHRILKEFFRKKKVFVIHRLDKETSGLMMFATEQKAYEKLKEMMRDRKIRRDYMAIVEGQCPHKKWRQINYLLPLGKNKMQVFEEKKPETEEAETYFKVVNTHKKYTVLHAQLQTGKKHQIRCQLGFIGHPVIGDKKYGSKHNYLHRLGLHATKLTFMHPMTGDLICLDANFPEQFLQMKLDFSEINQKIKESL